jgi:hypothetical protein
MPGLRRSEYERNADWYAISRLRSDLFSSMWRTPNATSATAINMSINESQRFIPELDHTAGTKIQDS